MNAKHLIGLLLILVLLAGCQPIMPVTEQSAAMSMEQQKIQSAMSGGLMAIAKDATVLDWPAAAGADPVKLREGTNGWVCRPDDPVSPINDPRCFNADWLKLSGKPFDAEREANNFFGFAYMLQGGAAADNFNPAILEPAADQDWVIDGPHVMVVFSRNQDSEAFSSDHHMGGPYVMFEGTPAEHLMIPAPVGQVMPSADPIGNAMSGGPLKIAENATILDWPKEAGGEWTELRKGDNGWTCLPDDPLTPSNDPYCLDPAWLAWMKAYMAGEEPQITALGIGYMLQGGTAASNIDPFALEPAAGDVWHVEPPHIMFIFPNDLDPAAYSSDYQSGQPWVMFDDTPYEHLMVPVTEMHH
jgi:hypothetical protein